MGGAGLYHSSIRDCLKTMVVDPPSWTSGTFRYDGSGNIYTIGVAGEPAVTPHTHTYDNLSRLTQATNLATLTPQATQALSHSYEQILPAAPACS